MTWNFPDPPKPPGEWASYSTGQDYRAWILTCGRLFYVHITASGGRYYTAFNGGSLPVADKLPIARAAAERAIVAHVREMLPAYRAIYERVKAQSSTLSHVTPIRPIVDF